MFANWVICVFSYNRGGLLRNLLRSVAECYPEMGIAIFDDGSDDEMTLAVLQEVEAEGAYVYMRPDRDLSSKHGGLYYLMNKALAYAYQSNYQYAYFVQDDMQFLWRDDSLPHKVSKVFERDDCLMCNSSFMQKILIEGIEDRLPQIEEQLFEFKGNGVADTGIIDIAKAKRVELSFPKHSEGGNGSYWYEKGLRLYWLPQPHLAWVPWPTTYRHKVAEHRQANSIYTIKGKALEQLQGNKRYAYLEDYTKTHKWYPKPYWYAANPGKINLLKIYVKYYLRRIFK